MWFSHIPETSFVPFWAQDKSMKEQVQIEKKGKK